MTSAYDPTYDQRVGARNKLKTEAITRALENEFGQMESVLDIGCNAGYITRALLNGGITANACGFDLNRDVVSASLMADPRFSFIEGDVVEHAFSETYDGIIYAAVHHHILGLNGWDAALELWCKIVSSCNRVLVFETGSVRERGKLYWKDAILRHFGGDREHLDALLKATKNRLVEVEEITRLPINGADRPVQLLTFKPIYYDCHVVTGSGSASRGLHPFLSAWAGTRRINLYPGTLNLEYLAGKVYFPRSGISLLPWEGALNNADSWRKKNDYDSPYNPRIYPARLNGLDVWVFSWGSTVWEHIEIVAPVNMRQRFGLKDGDQVRLEFKEG